MHLDRCLLLLLLLLLLRHLLLLLLLLKILRILVRRKLGVRRARSKVTLPTVAVAVHTWYAGLTMLVSKSIEPITV